MNVILAIFLVAFFLFFVFGNITVNDFYKPTFIQRVLICCIIGLIISLIIGLPVLGVLYLFK